MHGGNGMLRDMGSGSLRGAHHRHNPLAIELRKLSSLFAIDAQFEHCKTKARGWRPRRSRTAQMLQLKLPAYVYLSIIDRRDTRGITVTFAIEKHRSPAAAQHASSSERCNLARHSLSSSEALHSERGPTETFFFPVTPVLRSSGRALSTIQPGCEHRKLNDGEMCRPQEC